MLTASEIREQFKAIEKTSTGLQHILDQREQTLIDLLERGNIPDYCLAMTSITVEEGGHRLVYQASNDWLSFGTKEDAIRMPMLRKNVLPWVKENGYLLPTRKMVNQIFAAAGAQIFFEGAGAPYDTPHMTSIDRYWGHNALINTALGDERLVSLQNNGLLLAGPKKDIITSAQQRGDNIVIYGGHVAGGVTQDLQPAHGWYWIDYSQCFRLIASKCELDGQEADLLDVLQNPLFTHLINDEGVPFHVIW